MSSAKKTTKLTAARKKEIRDQIAICRKKGHKVRWDLVDRMDRKKSMTFKYGGRKFLAIKKTGLIAEIFDNKEYSDALDLNPGDVFLYGETNWFCTFGVSQIVDMMALDDSVKKEKEWHYERVKGPIYNQKGCGNADLKGDKRGIASVGLGSQFCDTQQESKESYPEYDEDVVEAAGPDDYFISREIYKENGKEIGYLNMPLQPGDVVLGPSGSTDMWIVSKSNILRRTYIEHEHIRKDIKIECGQVFDVGDNLHYACNYMKRYALVSKYINPDTIKARIKTRNKKKAMREKRARGGNKVNRLDEDL